MRLSFAIRTKHRLHGDTIVEVLMSIAIVGAVIAGAYALAGRSLAEGVSASEHSQAIKLAEAQIETLKSRNKDSLSHVTDIWEPNFDPHPRAAVPPTNKNNFCLDTRAISMLDNLGAVKPDWKPQYNGNGGPGFTGNNLVVGTGADQYNVQCTDTRNAATAKYLINISMQTHANKGPTYLVTVRWNPAGNAPTSQTQIYYRF